MPTRPASQCKLAYTVTGEGAVHTSLNYEPVEGLFDMPEFGLLMKLPAELDRIRWYGNGPAETYADRKMGARLGVYEGLVADQAAKNLVPQETGNKTGVRWAEVTDRLGRGLRFSAAGASAAGEGMEFSALPWTPAEMENARHPNELPPAHATVVRPALARMGIAGDQSWGAQTHPEYLLPAGKPLSFSFTFQGI